MNARYVENGFVINVWCKWLMQILIYLVSFTMKNTIYPMYLNIFTYIALVYLFRLPFIAAGIRL